MITMKGWKWSDGETVNGQDVVFWLNMMKAEKANFYGYAPGLLPDNLVSATASGNTVTLQLNQAYSSDSGSPTTSSPRSRRCPRPGT